MKGIKVVYFISTVFLTLLMLFSAGMYIFNHAEIVKAFEHLGHPAHVIYPLAIAKILGLIAIWTDYSKALKEWAYAGFFFDFVLAWMAHYFAGDGLVGLALPAILILLVSYFSYKQLEEIE